MNFYDESGTTPFLPRDKIQTVLLDAIDLLDRYFFLPTLLQTYMFGLGCSTPTYIENMLDRSALVPPVNKI
jgi:hypothetical protein